LMVTEVPMPDLSTLDYTMETGTVTKWYKKEGDRVQKGEPLLEIMSAKVTMDIESPASGVLAKILVQDGSEVPPGTVLATIE